MHASKLSASGFIVYHYTQNRLMFNSIVFLFFSHIFFVNWRVTLIYYYIYRKVIKMTKTQNGRQKNVHITFLTNKKIYFKLTLTTIYANCIRRVSQKMGDKKKFSLCEDDPSLVSNFFNGKVTSNNPYLITKKLLDYHSNQSGERIGAVPVLKFKNEFEVLWGSTEDFEQNLFPIFYCLIKDILNSNYKNPHTENQLLIQNVLCDDITFAKYYSFYQLKETFQLLSTLPYFGIHDELISPDLMGDYLLIAIDHLFQRENFKESFSSIFKAFISKHANTDYKHIDSRLETYFLPKLLTLLKMYIPSHTSPGVLMKAHIDNDFLKAIYLMHDIASPSEQIAYKELVQYSSNYLTILERHNGIF